MHELSIATSIIKTSMQEMHRISGKKVTEVYLEIGTLAGVEIASLEFVWEQCVADTPLQNSTLFIEQPRGEALCAECGCVFHVKELFDNCPSCNSPFKEIKKGKELKIKKIVII